MLNYCTERWMGTERRHLDGTEWNKNINVFFFLTPTVHAQYDLTYSWIVSIVKWVVLNIKFDFLVQVLKCDHNIMVCYIHVYCTINVLTCTHALKRFFVFQGGYGSPTGFDRTRNVEIGNKNIVLHHVEEAYTSEHWLVRIYRFVKLPISFCCWFTL